MLAWLSVLDISQIFLISLTVFGTYVNSFLFLYFFDTSSYILGGGGKHRDSVGYLHLF